MRAPLFRASAITWLVLAFASLLFAAQPNDSPAVDIASPNYQYKLTVHSFKELDFHNFALVIFDYDGRNPRTVHLRNGKYEKSWSSREGLMSVSLGEVHYINASNREPQYALLDIGDIEGLGSSTNTGILQVVRLKDNHIKVVQQLSYDLQAPGTGVTFNPETGILLITGRSNDDSAHCCPKSVDVMTFKWTGASFRLQSFDSHSLPVQP
ncbi:MAG: hypothetical protein ACLP1Y_12745 [Candidatus Acidiferrales bacterium]